MGANDEAKGTDGSPADPKRIGVDGGVPGASGNVGNALRSVYDETLRESVPDDLMDLLGKLS